MTAYPHNAPDVIAAAQAGDQAAREQVVLGYTQRVYGEAAKIARTYGLDKDDLVQAGYEAVLKAIAGYDAGQGYAPSTYIFTAIHRSIMREVERQIGLPQNSLAMRALDGGRQPLLKMIFRGLPSLDAPTKAGSERTLGDIIPDGVDAEGDVDDALLAQMVCGMLDRTTPHRRRALTLYYGLDGREPMDTKQIAEMLGCSYQNVSGHVKAGAEDLRKALADVGIEGMD